MTESIVTIFVTLFVIIDPIGLAPIFVALTPGMSQRARRGIALRAVCIAFAILAVFAIAGEPLLNAAGIGMPAFRISGGILLFLIAVEMLFEKRTPRREKAAGAEVQSDPSVFPLALPLLAGPGAMATVILVMSGEGTDLTQLAIVLGVVATVLLITLVLFLGAGLLERVLGATGINVITRILGVLLAALSIQFILDGLADIGVIGGV
ncbi:MAG: MarC family protein [Pseudomonadota bacterium]